jgi:branched-subunit amino acid ABC-type transport system permease component
MVEHSVTQDRFLIFGILILVLVFRPSGLLGEATPDKV